MHLVFVDDPSRLPDLRHGEVLVATDPEVEIVAESQGREYVRFWGHVDPLALQEDGEATYEPLTRACAALDSYLSPGASAQWHYRRLKVLLDGLRGPWLAAEALVADLEPSRATLRLREGSWTYDALACGLPALGLEVRADVSPAAPVPAVGARPPSPRSRVSWLLHRPRRRGSPLVLCSDTLYGVEPVAAALRDRGAEVDLLLPAPVAERALSLPRAGLEAFRELFLVGGADLSPVGLARVSTLLERGLPRSAAAYRGARRAFGRLRPDAILGSVYEAPRSKAIAAAAHAEDVPVFVTRHGELGIRRLPYSTYQDLDAVDVALCWGEWEARLVRDYAHRSVRPLVVGAPSMEAETAPTRAAIRAELGFGESDIVVLYLPAGFGDGTWIAARVSPVPSDHLLHRRAVLSALGALSGVETVLKMPSTSPGEVVEGALVAAAPDARVVSGRPYSELIHLADAVVIDFPSTTLVQALRGSARIFVVDHPVMDWMPGVREHLTAHGVVFVSVEGLHDCLAEELASSRLAGPHKYAADAVEPLAASGREAAADRAAEAVLRIVSDREQERRARVT